MKISLKGVLLFSTLLVTLSLATTAEHRVKWDPSRKSVNRNFLNLFQDGMIEGLLKY
jgi:hypothetical protein